MRRAGGERELARAGAMSQHRAFAVPLPKGDSLSLGRRPLVMGILNVTPDSFSDGGEHQVPVEPLS